MNLTQHFQTKLRSNASGYEFSARLPYCNFKNRGKMFITIQLN